MDRNMINQEEERQRLITQRNRNRALFSCACRWLELYEDGTNLLPYFQKHGYRRIAIYGAAELGHLLLKELQKEPCIEVCYFLDRTAQKQQEKWGLPVYAPQELADLSEVDLIVVTAFFAFEEIQGNLMRLRPEAAVVSIEKLIGIMENEVWYAKR